MKQFLVDLLGAGRVLDTDGALALYSEDFTELEPRRPDLVARIRSREELQAIVREAGPRRVPLVPRVWGTNIGGLALAEKGGIILDLTEMNQVLEVNTEDMYAVIEPGVTQRILKQHLIDRNIPLTFGFSLAPPDTSVFANALLGGLSNRSLRYGDQSLSISGLEVVTANGSLLRTGSWAVEGVPPFGRVPLPDLTGLYVGWQGATGIATRLAFQLWPKHPLERRLFYLTYDVEATYDVMQRLCRAEVCEDIGGLSWPCGKMMLGVRRPHPEPAAGEPLFFLYLDLAAETPRELAAREEIVAGCFEAVAARGAAFDGPLDIRELVRVNRGLEKFAEFPTDLEFLTNHGGGGLSWIGTYGPVSRFARAARVATDIMAPRGWPPVIVSRPMRGGHYGVIRFITTFDRRDPDEVRRVREVNAVLLEALTAEGFLMYKTPVWAWKALASRMDPGMLRLMRELKGLLDPDGIFNPGRMDL
ncbi:MAG: FAD-binding oxidoreductase [Deltaproteobacteria bacterium]|nr:FAD-binding oxidoreductase [Deltaproteobacteria bacterium]